MPLSNWQNCSTEVPKSHNNLKMHNCVIVGGRSHPQLVDKICQTLDVEPAQIDSKIFSNGETHAQVKESVREKHVFVIQSSYGLVNDYLMELLILISALKMASAKSVTAVLPIFPYSRQIDNSSIVKRPNSNKYDTDSHAELPKSQPGSGDDSDIANRLSVNNSSGKNMNILQTPKNHGIKLALKNISEAEIVSPRKAAMFGEEIRPRFNSAFTNEKDNQSGYNGSIGHTQADAQTRDLSFDSHTIGTRKWIAQGGPLIASLLTTAGTDHVITMDLHDPQYQGFFDVPFDNLLFRPLLIEYIKSAIPTYHSSVIVSPDAGGAKRATRIADQLHMRFALIHQDRRNNATLLVGDVNDRVAIVIDDLVDSGKTIIRAAKILKDHGAIKVVAICTHGIFSGDTITGIKDSEIDSIVTTNSVPQDANQAILGDRMHIVDISLLFAEAIRRKHNGESLSRLYTQAPMVIEN